MKNSKMSGRRWSRRSSIEQRRTNYEITPKIAQCLMRIEAFKAQIVGLPVNPVLLMSLRETARLFTTHYSTMIEGNRLSPDQIDQVLQHQGHFPGRERDEHEVKGYYAALAQVEQWAASRSAVTEKMIQTLHGLVVAEGKKNCKSTPYRDGQNVIKDGRTGRIVYMPPEAKDVAGLMTGLVDWIKESKNIPCPLVAAIVHYQFATIHPYFDGNGRTARLLTTLVLHLGGYDLKGLYCLEEYYARNLGAYYQAISVGDSHNYYMGRAQADITGWIEYFVEGVVQSFENVFVSMTEVATRGLPDQSDLLRTLDARQRKVLELFYQHAVITSKQVAALFGFKSRTGAQLCAHWVQDGFLEIVDASNKGRSYGLAKKYEALILRK